MTKLSTRLAAGVAATLLLATGANAASGNSIDILEYIPADTPYVFVSMESLPEELADKFAPQMQDILNGYQTIGRHMIGEQVAEMIEEGAEFEDVEQFRAVAEEFLGLLSIEGMRDAGITGDSAFAVYGNGILPVLRVELTESELFDATIARIEEKSGKPLQTGEARGKSYRYTDDGSFQMLITTEDEQLVLTMVPNTFDEKQVASSLGFSKPRKNLKKAKTVLNLAREYGFSNYMLGYIDNVRLGEMFTGGGSDLDKEIFAATDGGPPELDAVCSGEMMDMVRIAPRIAFGYTELSEEQIDSTLVIELRSDIAAGLASIPSAVPGLGLDPGGFMSMGMGLDIIAMRAFIETQLDAIEAEPYECEALAMLEFGAAKTRASLAQPLPPVVYSFKGFVANLHDLECADLACDSPPEKIDASIMFAVDKAQDLIMMAAMMDPQIASLNLMPDSEPVRLENPQLAMFAEDAFAAMSDTAVAIAIGVGAEKNAAGVLHADSNDPAPFFSMSMDSKRYYRMLVEAMQAEPVEDEEEEPMPVEVRDAWTDILYSSGGFYDRVKFEVQFTERGFELQGLGILSN